jgi:hypothetical protein
MDAALEMMKELMLTAQTKGLASVLKLLAKRMVLLMVTW